MSHDHVPDKQRVKAIAEALRLSALERMPLASLAPDELEDAVATVSLLQRRLKADRLPEIARRPADAFAGRTMLQMLGERPAELRRIVGESLDFSLPA